MFGRLGPVFGHLRSVLAYLGHFLHKKKVLLLLVFFCSFPTPILVPTVFKPDRAKVAQQTKLLHRATCPKIGQNRAKMAQHRTQERPNSPQAGPKRLCFFGDNFKKSSCCIAQLAARQANTEPTWPKIAPTNSQHSPKQGQHRPKTKTNRKIVPRRPQDREKMPQHRTR